MIYYPPTGRRRGFIICHDRKLYCFTDDPRPGEERVGHGYNIQMYYCQDRVGIGLSSDEDIPLAVMLYPDENIRECYQMIISRGLDE